MLSDKRRSSRRRAAAEAEALRLDAARSGAQEELVKLKCVNEKLTQEAERVDRVRLDEERRSAARRASESKRQQDAKKALTERAQLVKELESARRDAASARALVARERKRRTASVNGFGRDLQELRKALSRVAAAVDASSMHQGRASARAARCCVGGATTPWSCCLLHQKSTWGPCSSASRPWRSSSRRRSRRGPWTSPRCLPGRSRRRRSRARLALASAP